MFETTHFYKETKGKPIEKDCVCQTITRIYQAQKKASGIDCLSSCEQAIHQLKGHQHNRKHTTIPFMLYSDCGKPFISSGVYKCRHLHTKKEHYECITSPIFRVKYIDEDSCCATLELLLPVRSDGSLVCKKAESICAYFPTTDPATDFIATHLCITVNLHNFSAVFCLDPITPLPAMK
ncbi:CotY/CotZ family spore coat protein [Paracerasibacillus soli]|uniref:CotY/CotZ family spore coat protein n=1 Tax=Paracerasibacillus soli TaxID=480284 RepID=A0ABU5CVE7_9BACI|nr:CotY/CotZ family spore coat protein [Virgibacillus soli]MDY0410347.1 CotY/CotZ family spore coat protein [Virgibacillus soli]